MNKKITLEWEFIDSYKKAISEFEKIDKLENDIPVDEQLTTIFEDSMESFKNDDKLRWDENQPLIIKWKIRFDSSNEIQDIIIDKEISLIKTYDEYMKQIDNFDYTILDEIINLTKSSLIDTYENLIPFEFNELAIVFDNEGNDKFGYDLYQLNATNSSDGEVFIIDASSAAIKNNVFDSIKTDFENNIEIINGN